MSPWTPRNNILKGLAGRHRNSRNYWERFLRNYASVLLRFSNWGSASIQEDDRDKIVVAGIECHVCVQQTVLDLMAYGFRVFVPADAVASRHKFDWEIALRRMSDSGATITTTESVLLEWSEIAGTDEFKLISNLITGR